MRPDFANMNDVDIARNGYVNFVYMARGTPDIEGESGPLWQRQGGYHVRTLDFQIFPVCDRCDSGCLIRRRRDCAVGGFRGMETVVVTAERRAEPLFDVPATITAISGEKLQNLGITDMKSIVEMVPNAVLPDDPENFETYINIRGVHQADINAEPNFGLYRNGIFAGGERANLGAQIDIDNVDILSGPQSGLYGRDAVGGVVNVNYKTASTSDPLGGYAIASYGNWQRSELQGAVNIPLTDNFAVRATGWWINQNQGQIYNPTLGDYIDANRDIGGRVSAKWEANNRLSFLWMAELEDRHGPSFDAYAPNGIGAVFNVRCCGLPVQGPETLKTVYEDTANTEHWQQFYLSQDVNYDTNSWAGTFELLGAYRNYHLHLQEDQDHTAFGPTYSPMVLQQIQYRFEGMHNFYGELLWKSPDNQPLTWMAGVDYFNETFTFQRIFDGSVDFNLLNTPAFGPGFTYGNLLCSFLMAGNDPPGSYDGGCEGTPGVAPGLPGAGLNGQFPYNFPNIGVQSGANAFGGPGSGIDTKSISGFGTVTYKFTDALSVTGELRWDQTQKHLNYSQGPVAGYGATALGASYLDPLFAQIFDPYTDVQTDTYVNLAPSVNIQYKLSDTANLYATYATGFRSGGFNLGTSSADHSRISPRPTRITKSARRRCGSTADWGSTPTCSTCRNTTSSSRNTIPASPPSSTNTSSETWAIRAPTAQSCRLTIARSTVELSERAWAGWTTSSPAASLKVTL